MNILSFTVSTKQGHGQNEWREDLEEALVQGEEHLSLLSEDPPEQDVETWFTRYDGNPIPIPYVAEQ